MSVEILGASVRMGRRRVLHDVSLSIPGGQVTALVGPNGAGKSTLLRAIAGVQPLEAGGVRVVGTDLAFVSPRKRARMVALVPQEAHMDYPFTVAEVVAMGRYAHLGPFGTPGATDAIRVAESLESTGLTDLRHRRVNELSRGEQQRTLVARALAQDAGVLLLDEPTANLDLGHAERLRKLVRKEAGHGRAVLAVLHDLETAAEWGNQIVLMADGRVLVQGPPRQVLTPASISSAFGVNATVTWDDGSARVRVAHDEPI